MTQLWPHQQRALDEIGLAIAEGYQRILVAAPTGAGKTRIMEELLAQGGTAALYTDRVMLMEQLAERLRSAGFSIGIRASGWQVNVLPSIQLCMLQTEHSRVIRAEDREHHRAARVLFDEAHRHKADQARGLRALHLEDGAVIIGFTATPIGLGDLYDKIIVAATTSECRHAGALLPAWHYAPDEPDHRELDKNRLATGDFSDPALHKQFVRPVIFGRVYDHWRKLNPDARPALLFGPDVPGSKWFAEQFEAKGVPSAHVDGSDIIIRGEHYESSREVREQLLADYKAGEIPILTNRFVLREGIDVPTCYHAIFATSFGSLTSYIQAGGRVLRNHPSMDHVIIQDHGGNWWRHGSLNSDRQWELDTTEKHLRLERGDRMRNKEEREPIACPECHAVRNEGKQCKNCGHISHGKARVVIQKDGQLREVRGDIFKPRRETKNPSHEQEWIATLFRCANAKDKMTFNQAVGLFRREHNGLYPKAEWDLVPKRDTEGIDPVTRQSISALSKRQNQERRAKNDDNGLFGGHSDDGQAA